MAETSGKQGMPTWLVLTLAAKVVLVLGIALFALWKTGMFG